MTNKTFTTPLQASLQSLATPLQASERAAYKFSCKGSYTLGVIIYTVAHLMVPELIFCPLFLTLHGLANRLNEIWQEVFMGSDAWYHS